MIVATPVPVQIGASHFLPIFYRPAETGRVRTLTKNG